MSFLSIGDPLTSIFPPIFSLPTALPTPSLGFPGATATTTTQSTTTTSSISRSSSSGSTSSSPSIISNSVSSSSSDSALPTSSVLISTSANGATPIIITETASASASSSAIASPANSSNAFLNNKPLAGAVFAIIGIISLATIFALVTFVLRRRRRKMDEHDAISFDPSAMIANAEEGSTSTHEAKRAVRASIRSGTNSASHAHGVGPPSYGPTGDDGGMYGAVAIPTRDGWNDGYHQEYAHASAYSPSPAGVYAPSAPRVGRYPFSGQQYYQYSAYDHGQVQPQVAQQQQHSPYYSAVSNNMKPLPAQPLTHVQSQPMASPYSPPTSPTSISVPSPPGIPASVEKVIAAEGTIPDNGTPKSERHEFDLKVTNY